MAKLQRLHGTMQALLPQIRYWLRTGFVAKNKIVSLYIPGDLRDPPQQGRQADRVRIELGITRLRGGFLKLARSFGEVPR